jgi:MFS family permease
LQVVTEQLITDYCMRRRLWRSSAWACRRRRSGQCCRSGGDVDIALDTAGLLLTAFFIGSIGSSALVAFALHGRDTRVLCAVGLGGQLLGTVALGFAPTWPLVLASGLIIGIGDGFVVAGTHILIPATSDDVPSALAS